MKLTTTDLQVLALTPFLSNERIGQALGIKRITVRWHLQKCYAELKVPDVQGEYRRALAVMLAIKRGLLDWQYMAAVEQQIRRV